MKYAFPISAYLTESAAGGRSSGGVTMQSISSPLSTSSTRSTAATTRGSSQ